MFAIIKTGGKQFKVQKDDVLAVDKLEGKADKFEHHAFTQSLSKMARCQRIVSAPRVPRLLSTWLPVVCKSTFFCRINDLGNC